MPVMEPSDRNSVCPRSRSVPVGEPQPLPARVVAARPATHPMLIVLKAGESVCPIFSLERQCFMHLPEVPNTTIVACSFVLWDIFWHRLE